MPSGSVTYKIFEESFVCNTVKKLVDCTSGDIYYTADQLIYSGSSLTTGETFSAKFVSADGYYTRCVTYTDDVEGSSTISVQSVLETFASCGSCGFTPTPSVTPTMTPTSTVTPTPTPTPTPSGNLVYVFTSCTGTNRAIILPVSVPGVSTGQSIEYNNECWTFIGPKTSPYTPPAGFTSSNFGSNIFGTPSEVFSSCSNCVNQPTPTPTYRAHTVIWNWYPDCPLCDLTGPTTTLYTEYQYTSLGYGVNVYTNTALTIPFGSGRYIKDSQYVYSVGAAGELTLDCVIGNGC